MWLFVLLVIVPIIEIALFVKIGGLIGLGPTIAIVILTALLGSWLLKREGLAALARLEAAVLRGDDPSPVLIDGILILAAGLLLLTPGFFTDTIGFLLLLPPTRAAFIRWAGRQIVRRVVILRRGRGGHGAEARRAPRSSRTTIIDGVDYTVIEED